MTLTKRQRDIAVSIGVVALGIFFLSQTNAIPVSRQDTFAPDLVPRTLSWVIIGLGLLSVVANFLFPSVDAAEEVRLPLKSVVTVAGVSLIGLGYYFLFLWFGYLVATTITLGITLFTFGIRKPMHLGSVTLVGALAYYLVFIRLMRVYDPAGQLVDFSALLPF